MKTTAVVVGIVLVIWLMLTLWVQYSGEPSTLTFGPAESATKALIIYNPDPIYNLDQQVCTSYAEGLAAQGISVQLITVEHSYDIDTTFDLYVFCTNTYNFAPDWRVIESIQSITSLKGSKTVAITLGAGTTNAAKRSIEKSIFDAKAKLIDSFELWLLKPNDDNRLDESNSLVAKEIAYERALNLDLD